MNAELKAKALRGALDAIDRGFKVIPISENAVTKDGKWQKKPRIPEWPIRATSDKEQVKRWAEGDYGDLKGKLNRRWDDETPCGCFGATTDGLIAFDVDSDDALNALRNIFKAAGEKDITPTYAVKSGRGGSHWVYRQPEGFSLGLSAGVLAPHLDTRGGASGQIVLPGTMNPVTQTAYEILHDAPISVPPVAVAEVIAPKLGRARTADTVRNQADRRNGSIPDTPRKVDAFAHYLLDKDGGVEGAGGESDLLEVGMRGADLGLSEEKTVELAYAIYNPRCSPPWEAEEFAAKIRNAFRYRESEIGCDDPDLAVGLLLDGAEAGDDDVELQEGDLEAFPVESMAVFRETPPKPRRSLLEGFMAYGPYLTLIYGRGGSGKSLLMQQMMRELQRNREFLGMKPGSVCTEGGLKTLILSCEEPRDDVHSRYYEQSKQIDPEGVGAEPMFCDLRNKDSFLFRKGKDGIHPTELMHRLVRVVRKLGVNNLVIDSLSHIFPGNEIDRAEVTAFGRTFNQFCMKTGCHVIILAHTNRAGDFSGSSAWEAICRQMFLISSTVIGEDVFYSITVEKTNEGKRGVSAHYQFKDWYYVPVLEEELDALRRKEENQAADQKHKAHEDKVASARLDLKDVILANGGSVMQRALEDELKGYGHTQKAVRDAIDQAILDGEVVKVRGAWDSNRHRPWVIQVAEYEKPEA